MIGFKTAKTDAVLIGKIVRRALVMAALNKITYDAMDANMDITARRRSTLSTGSPTCAPCAGRRTW